MPKSLLALLALAGTIAPALGAQTDLYLRGGVTGSSVLVHDVIGGDVNTRPGLAPTLFVGVGRKLSSGYGLGLEAALSSGGLHTDYQSTRSDLGSIRIASALALADGRISGPLRWRVGFGAIHYFASNEAGLLAGSGSTRLLVGGGADFRRPVLAGWDLMVSGRYDFNRFSSPALRARGFTQSQGVQRVSLSLGLARGHR